VGKTQGIQQEVWPSPWFWLSSQQACLDDNWNLPRMAQSF
jgi:hypothetical protein